MTNLLDSLILSSATERWKKVAKIIAMASDREGDAANLGEIVDRLCALVDDGKLEGKSSKERAIYRAGDIARFAAPNRARRRDE